MAAVLSEVKMVRELVLKNRSCRRFHQEHKITPDVLKELIDLARLSPSGGNLQPLKYILSFDEKKNRRIFPYLKWAGYLKDWDGPEEGERPAAYIVMLGDSEISSNYFWDHGIACQSILLGACEKGLGGCIFGSVDRDGLKKELDISDRFELLMVIALGKPKEKIVLEEVKENKDIKYWRDENQVHHVPKRKLSEIIISG